MKNNYQRKPLKVTAIQWFKSGDSKLVKRYLQSAGINNARCYKCDDLISNHGKLHLIDKVKMICPGTWVIEDEYGDIYCCSDEMFKKNYEVIDEN